MANVRCPMCSNLNPPEAEICSNCGARLKPAQPGETPGGTPGSDEPEWLRSLRTGETGGEAQPSEPASPDEENIPPGDVPEWLARIRDRARTDVPPEDETGEDSAGWLEGLVPDAAPGADQPADWAARLPGQTPGDPAPQQPPEGAGPSRPTSAFGMTDFLAGLEDRPDEGPSEQKPHLDWGEDTSMPRGEPAGELPAQPGEGEIEIPGWLQDMSEDTPEEVTPHQGSSENEFELPDWLNGDEPASQEEPGQPSEEPVAAEGPQAEEAALPGWLAGLSAGEPGESAPEEAGLPGSASELPVEQEAPSSKEPPVEPPAGEKASAEEASEDISTGLPAWINEEAVETPQNSAEPEAAEAAEAVEEAGAPQAEPAGEGMPDWFASFEEASDRPEEPPAPSGEEEAAGETPAGETPAEDVPEWLRDFDTRPAAGATVPALIETGDAAQTPAGLEADQPFAMDLPDWLGEESEEKADETAEQPAEPVKEELAQAELPEWVKEMRPIESIIPGEGQITEPDKRTEKVGPLAGMSGILAAEELVTQYRRPPVYSVKLRVSEKQRSQTSLFESILAQETQPLMIPRASRRGQGIFWRAIIALLLIVLLSAPRLLNMAPLATPALFPVETQRMYDQIEQNLAPNAPVLLAVDYEPALSGEMNLAAMPVMEHLLSKNVRIVVVSTRPTGPALAEKLLNNAAADHPEYNLAEQTVNLGYLPGDMISLLEFARQPAFAAPGALGGELAWEKPVLKGIGGMTDFARVVVLTDSAETGRVWVEQVQTQMGSVPLLMVTSAQAGPMMVPFVESGQVSGMITGLLGGVQYAQWAKQAASPVLGYLASYQVGVVVALGLVLLGGLVSALRVLVRRNDKGEE